MIVFGGVDAAGTLASGGRYHRSSNVWGTPPASAGAPSARAMHTAVWTGTEMIIWGGDSSLGGSGSPLATGARYNPATNIWAALPTAGAPSARSAHSAVWTGTEMIIWAGNGSTNASSLTALNDGARYNPATNSWAPMATDVARSAHTAVWTGSKMLIWGGYNAGNVQAGAIYDPVANTWTPMPLGPQGRANHTAVWTGSEMIVWGGAIGGPGTSSGGRYFP
jgi:N-acetylneuraminic acid mutarotase